jgi:pimeloyl-ACP methyl ester carboxylesterase
MTTNELTPFRIDVPQADLDDLHRRLDATRWPDELPGVGWEYGVATGYLRDLVQHWQTGFDWRAVEARLNEMPQFTTRIDGQQVHLVHVRSPRPDATPLLMTHGWPSTVADFLPVVGPLTDPDAHGAPGAPAFHLVLPSLPGFGFSGPTTEPGWSITRIARAWLELMDRLGYSRFLTQGGDTGSLVSPEVARLAPDRVLGVHLNAEVTAGTIDWTAEDPTAGLTEEEAGTLYAAAALWEQRQGYAIVQGTRPQTLAYALNDSPVGLLAWDLEWFVDHDPAAATQTPVDPDAILTDVTTTWLTGTAGSSARIYKDAGDAFSGGPNSGVPTAVAVFPGDHAIRTLAERSHTIVRWTEYDRGGHFASLQAPDLLVDDLRAFTHRLPQATTRPARTSESNSHARPSNGSG